MSKDILVVDDDKNICEVIKLYLQKEDFRVTLAYDGQAGIEVFERNTPALVVLDIMMPRKDGWEVLKQIRKSSSVPVIMLTAKGETFDKVLGLELGADDYIVKPFDLEILYSRICAILRRTGNKEDGLLTCSMITLDKNRIQVFCEKDEIPLSAMEYQLLLVLMENKNHTLTRNRLLEIIWDANGNFVNDNTLTVTMKRLREKLHNPPCLKTIRSFGYRMEDVL